jgi:hypothetical protein
MVTALNRDEVDELIENTCWCCGKGATRSEVVRLGNHPEVAVCVNCAHFLHRRARDLQATGTRKRLRDGAETIRQQVIARDLHNRPVIGPALRWINKHSPW